jgi:transposase-like protein
MTYRLLRLSSRCPNCGVRPRSRIPPEERDLALEQPPEAVKQTYQCHHCGHTYPITAADYQSAA